MAAAALNIVHREFPGGGRFEAQVGGGSIELDYARSATAINFHHTGTSPSLRGQGLAGVIVERGLTWAASTGLQVIPSCSYVEVWLRRHPRWQRLLIPAAAQDVLNFWFSPLGGPEDGKERKAWFIKDEAFDEEIRSRFGALLSEAQGGRLQAWHDRGWAQLALVILLDQFSRNAFRGDAKSFAGDPLALAATLEMLDANIELDPLEHWFLLMPLEHAEDLALQDRSVSEFERLAARDARLASALDYARKHRDVIQRFGRFPHRNAILGRASTPEELAYLAQPGSGF